MSNADNNLIRNALLVVVVLVISFPLLVVVIFKMLDFWFEVFYK